MRNFLPFLQWLPSYSKRDLPRDLLAGFTVGIVLIPQAMAYAMIAGLSPVYGLYAALIPLVIYTFLGTSRSLAVGPVALDSLLVFIGLSAMALSNEEYVIMAVFLAFFVGAIQLILGLLRMGFLVNFLSKPVISAFTSAAALIIMFSQIKNLIGVETSQTNLFHELILNAFEKLTETNLFDLTLGVASMIIIIGFKKWNKRFPGILLAVILGILTVFFLSLEAQGVKIVGAVPVGLPDVQVPAIKWDAFIELWPIALTIAFVGYMEAISIAKGLEEKTEDDRLDPNQELVALGTSNMIGSFFNTYPVAASFSRSAIALESDSRSNLTGLFAALLVLITLLFLTPLFYYLPKAVLAGIIMVSVYGLMDFGYARRLWNLRKDEFSVWILTFLATLFIGIVQGIVIGAVIALLLMVYRTSRPHIAILGKIRDSDYYKNIERFAEDIEVRDDLLILRFDAQLYFGNANYFKRQLYKYINRKGPELKAVILNAEAINYIDSTGAQAVRKVIKELKSRDIQFYIVGAIGPTRDILFSSGIADLMNKEYIFVRIREAQEHFDNEQQSSALIERVAHQRNRKSK